MFYEEKKLSEFTDSEWEQVCMRCGKCCMIKFQENNVIHFSNLICDFYDLTKGTCSCYKTRLQNPSTHCVKVDMNLLENSLDLLPPDCAYRLLYEGKKLPDYHPLVSGKPNSVIKAKKTVTCLPVKHEREHNKDFEEFLKKVQSGRWSMEKCLEKIEKLKKKQAIIYLETYPTTTKN